MKKGWRAPDICIYTHHIVHFTGLDGPFCDGLDGPFRMEQEWERVWRGEVGAGVVWGGGMGCVGRGIRQTKSVYTFGSANPKVYTLSACLIYKFTPGGVNLDPKFPPPGV